MDDKLRAALSAALDPTSTDLEPLDAASPSLVTVPPVGSDAAHGLAGPTASLSDFEAGALESELVWEQPGLRIERAVRPGLPQLFSVTWSTAEYASPSSQAEIRTAETGAQPTAEACLALGPHDVVTVPRRGNAAGPGAAVALVFGVDAHGAFGVALGPRPYQLAPMASLSAPLAEWLAPDAPAWLVTLVAVAQGSNDPFTQVSAAGTIQRLQGTPDPAQALRALLAGEGVAQGPGAWFAALSAAQQDTVAALAHSAAEDVLDALGALDAGDVSGEPLDAEELLDALHARDDLEGVRVLFAATDGTSPLDGLLGFVDRAGRRLRACVELPSVAADPRLAAVAAGDPDAWWTLAVEAPLP